MDNFEKIHTTPHIVKKWKLYNIHRNWRTCIVYTARLYTSGGHAKRFWMATDADFDYSCSCARSDREISGATAKYLANMRLWPCSMATIILSDYVLWV